mmetsp:Transcript_17095/g.52813  ORF Transcript_17095/g.52813 Transcript_17095/m.52813 type:complete len:260 (+) Transcript_17095:2294-3073(+)
MMTMVLTASARATAIAVPSGEAETAEARSARSRIPSMQRFSADHTRRVLSAPTLASREPPAWGSDTMVPPAGGAEPALSPTSRWPRGLWPWACASIDKLGKSSPFSKESSKISDSRVPMSRRSSAQAMARTHGVADPASARGLPAASAKPRTISRSSNTRTGTTDSSSVSGHVPGQRATRPSLPPVTTPPCHATMEKMGAVVALTKWAISLRFQRMSSPRAVADSRRPEPSRKCASAVKVGESRSAPSCPVMWAVSLEK